MSCSIFILAPQCIFMPYVKNKAIGCHRVQISKIREETGELSLFFPVCMKSICWSTFIPNLIHQRGIQKEVVGLGVPVMMQ